MISRFKEHKYYSRNIKISLILSELIIICAFLFSPNVTDDEFLELNEPIFLIDDIPATIQRNSYVLARPKIPEIFIIGEISEPIILADVTRIEDIETETITGITIAGSNITNKVLREISPTQLLEVLPNKKNRNIRGSLSLRLKIDNSGKVAEHVILFNSLDCEDCLLEIISAVYRSVWQPAIKNGSETEFWVEKSYTFK